MFKKIELVDVSFGARKIDALQFSTGMIILQKGNPVPKTSFLHCSNGGFHSHEGTPIAGWFLLGKIPSFEMDDLGIPLFQETSK